MWEGSPAPDKHTHTDTHIHTNTYNFLYLFIVALSFLDTQLLSVMAKINGKALVSNLHPVTCSRAVGLQFGKWDKLDNFL